MNPSATAKRLPVRGFTLIELLVVLVVLGMALALVGPRFASGNPALAVRSAGQTLVAGLQLARNRAITENRAVVLRVDRASGAFVVDGRRRVLPDGVSLSRPDLDDDDPQRTPIEVRFFPDGSSSGAWIGVAHGAHRLLIDIDWLTGAIQTRDAEDRDV
ncbi:MAG: GspH/FimT family pseudopilin [Gammaproteobacteria bacterium]|nr:GspH/FimT family pseudopilin [Gammaproteobacteria bacterium]